MTGTRCSLTLLLSLALASACDSSTGPKDAAAAKAEGKDAKATDVKAPDAKGPANPHEANPHAAANPHAGMPPMMGTPPAPKGPPRDVTPSGETVAETLPGLAFAVPKEWEKGTPSNNMRLAQYVLPGPGGDGELVVFRFPGGAGGIEQNLERWKGQFQAPEGKTIDDVTTTKNIEAGALKITFVDVSGRYVAAVTPGAEEKHDEADQRMLAAIVEGSGDPFYFKAVGPRATMDVWGAAFDTMVGGFAGGDAAKADDAKPDDTKADDAKTDDEKPKDAKAKKDEPKKPKADKKAAGG